MAQRLVAGARGESMQHDEIAGRSLESARHRQIAAFGSRQ